MSCGRNGRATSTGCFSSSMGAMVVLFNGFQKKTQKTPQSEIDKAKRIKEEYYGTQKRQSDQGL